MASITVAQIIGLRAEVKRHKAAIYRHRLDLQTAAEALKRAEAVGRQIGLVLDAQPDTRVGDPLHGDTADQPARNNASPAAPALQPRHDHAV